MKKAVTSKSYRLTLNIVYFAPVSVMIIFSLVVLFLHASNQLTPSGQMVEIFQFIVPSVTIVFLASSYFIFRMLLAKINPSINLGRKLPKYQVAVMVRSALLELPGLLGGVTALITGEMYFLMATLLVLIVFILLRPTPYIITEELNLTAEEKKLLEDSDAIVS